MELEKLFDEFDRELEKPENKDLRADIRWLSINPRNSIYRIIAEDPVIFEIPGKSELLKQELKPVDYLNMFKEFERYLSYIYDQQKPGPYDAGNSWSQMKLKIKEYLEHKKRDLLLQRPTSLQLIKAKYRK